MSSGKVSEPVLFLPGQSTLNISTFESEPLCIDIIGERCVCVCGGAFKEMLDVPPGTARELVNFSGV